MPAAVVQTSNYYYSLFSSSSFLLIHLFLPSYFSHYLHLFLPHPLSSSSTPFFLLLPIPSSSSSSSPTPLLHLPPSLDPNSPPLSRPRPLLSFIPFSSSSSSSFSPHQLQTLPPPFPFPQGALSKYLMFSYAPTMMAAAATRNKKTASRDKQVTPPTTPTNPPNGTKTLYDVTRSDVKNEAGRTFLYLLTE